MKKEAKKDTLVLKLNDLNVMKDNGLLGISDFSLDVFKNEIVGIAGVAGNGQNELFDAIVGVRKVESGQIMLQGEAIHNLSPEKIIRKGLASIPPNRITQGLIMEFKIKENLILGRHRFAPFCKGINLQYDTINQFADKAIEDYNLAARSSEQVTRTLSGGNLQKLILARELSHEPHCVIASSPTRGLDIGATEFVHKRLIELRNSGIGILLISEDLDEILNISDRIAVIFNGKLMGVVDSEGASRESIGMLMAGVRESME